MIVVLPFCNEDAWLAAKNLQWAISLDGKVPMNCVLSVARDTEADAVKKLAEQYFQSVRVFTYEPTKEKAWPRPQNRAFQKTAWWAKDVFKEGWLWWEPDAVPLRKGWLQEIDLEYRRAGKAFLGPVVEPSGHINGVSVYPHNLIAYSSDVMLVQTVPWDVALKKSPGWQRSRHNSHLFQHVWGNPKEPLTFNKPEDLSVLKQNAVLFHRCKDGSLIDALSGNCQIGQGVDLSVFVESYSRELEKRVAYSNGESAPVPIKDKGCEIVHCVERHRPDSPQTKARVEFAFKSWMRVYATGTVKPWHVWNYPRNATEIGDKRELPYLKDVLEAGMERISKDDGIVLLTNDDTILPPDIAQRVWSFMDGKEACFCGRVTFKGAFPGWSQKYEQNWAHDIGKDLFAMRKWWIKDQWKNIPDMFLGELQWDLILSALIRKDIKSELTNKKNREELDPDIEMPKGTVLHAFHVRNWMHPDLFSAPAKEWNRKLSNEWYRLHGMPEMAVEV